MKKLLFLLMATIWALTACGNDEPDVKVEDAVKQDEVEKKEEPKKEESKIKLSETKVSFTNFTIEFKETKLKDGKLFLDALYTNDSFPGEKAFMAAAGIDVKQNDGLLEEVSGVMSNPKSNYFYKNEVGIWAPIEFEYELLNDTDDVEITIVPRDWEESSKTITVSFDE